MQLQKQRTLWWIRIQKQKEIKVRDPTGICRIFQVFIPNKKEYFFLFRAILIAFNMPRSQVAATATRHALSPLTDKLYLADNK